MDTHPKHLPADKRRVVTVQSVVELAGTQNPSEITTAAIDIRRDAPRVFAIYRRGIRSAL